MLALSMTNALLKHKLVCVEQDKKSVNTMMRHQVMLLMWQSAQMVHGKGENFHSFLGVTFIIEHKTKFLDYEELSKFVPPVRSRRTVTKRVKSSRSGRKNTRECVRPTSQAVLVRWNQKVIR